MLASRQTSDCATRRFECELTLSFFLVLNGNSAFLMKQSAKRRRSKAQIAQEKEEAELKAQQIAAKLAQFDTMQTQIVDMQEKLATAATMY